MLLLHKIMNSEITSICTLSTYKSKEILFQAWQTEQNDWDPRLSWEMSKFLCNNKDKQCAIKSNTNIRVRVDSWFSLFKSI